MPIANLEVIVEEPSMETFLRILIPRICPRLPSFQIRPFRCKQDLLAKLPDRLAGYSRWIGDDSRIMVLVDRDKNNCHQLKNRLHEARKNFPLRPGSEPMVINRIVIEELESWYFGDWEAVKAAYPRVSDSIPLKSSYRDPDAISGGTWECFERILQRAGYFQSGLRKIEAAQKIAPFMNPEINKSKSFQTFRDSLLKLSE